MGKRVTYYGCNTIVYTKKGRHHDCRYRGPDGACMNRSSMWFGEICREVGSSCKDYFSRFNNSEKKKTEKKESNKNIREKPILPISKPVLTARIGDAIIIHSITHNKDVTLEISQSQVSRSPIAEWAIGKTLGSKGEYNGNYFELKRIIKNENLKR